MTELRQSLDDYLTVRRSVGYKLEDAGRVLRTSCRSRSRRVR